MRTSVRTSILPAAALLVAFTGCDSAPPYAFRAITPHRDAAGNVGWLGRHLPYRFWDEYVGGTFETLHECQDALRDRHRNGELYAQVQWEVAVKLAGTNGWAAAHDQSTHATNLVVSAIIYDRCVPVR